MLGSQILSRYCLPALSWLRKVTLTTRSCSAWSVHEDGTPRSTAASADGLGKFRQPTAVEVGAAPLRTSSG